jgi:hypothetical protein
MEIFYSTDLSAETLSTIETRLLKIDPDYLDNRENYPKLAESIHFVSGCAILLGPEIFDILGANTTNKRTQVAMHLEQYKTEYPFIQTFLDWNHTEFAIHSFHKEGIWWPALQEILEENGIFMGGSLIFPRTNEKFPIDPPDIIVPKEKYLQSFSESNTRSTIPIHIYCDRAEEFPYESAACIHIHTENNIFQGQKLESLGIFTGYQAQLPNLINVENLLSLNSRQIKLPKLKKAKTLRLMGKEIELDSLESVHTLKVGSPNKRCKRFYAPCLQNVKILEIYADEILTPSRNYYKAFTTEKAPFWEKIHLHNEETLTYFLSKIKIPDGCKPPTIKKEELYVCIKDETLLATIQKESNYTYNTTTYERKDPQENKIEEILYRKLKKLGWNTNLQSARVLLEKNRTNQPQNPENFEIFDPENTETLLIPSCGFSLKEIKTLSSLRPPNYKLTLLQKIKQAFEFQKNCTEIPEDNPLYNNPEPEFSKKVEPKPKAKYTNIFDKPWKIGTSEKETRELTASEFSKEIEQKQETEAWVVTGPMYLNNHPLKQIHSNITFKENICITNCNQLLSIGGTYEKTVQFINCGITEIRDIKVENKEELKVAASFSLCENLKIATGCYNGFVDFSCSGITEIKDLTTKQNTDKKSVSFNLCKNLPDANIKETLFNLLCDSKSVEDRIELIETQKSQPLKTPIAKRKLKFTKSQTAVSEKIKTRMQLLLSGTWQSLPIIPRFHTLIVGPTGVGKSHTLRTIAETEGWGYFRGCPTDWIIECSKHEDKATLKTIYEFVRSKDAGIIHLDEIEKIGTGDKSDWMVYVKTELFNLLDGVIQSADSFPDAAAIREKLKTRFIIVGSGTWQDYYDEKASAGFIQSKPKHTRDKIKERSIIPRELTNRFSPEILEIEPITEEDIRNINLTLPKSLQIKLTKEKIEEIQSSKLNMRYFEAHILQKLEDPNYKEKTTSKKNKPKSAPKVDVCPPLETPLELNPEEELWEFENDTLST